ncbi:MAG: CYTH domain-containing protein [Corallococcus sp.]|nr:CYTH domain-containing protein [Bacillota bacterium]MCM1534080.1 CYTH domain-containing protein [Corallococcus sp.]
MKNIEQELKIALDEREYEILLNSAAVCPQLQTNFYFRCDNMSDDTMLRIRKKGEAYRVCYKKRLSFNAGVSVCDEREKDLDARSAKKLIADGITQSDLKKFFDLDVAENFRYVGKLDTYRAVFARRDWTLELDKNEYLGITDYELECENARIDALDMLKSYLSYNFGITFKPSDAKSKRFWDRYKSITQL